MADRSAFNRNLVYSARLLRPDGADHERGTRKGEHEHKGRDPRHAADQLLAARRPQRLFVLS